VEYGEKPDDLRIGTVELGEIEAIASDGQPVAGTMDGITIEQELAGDELPEGEFVSEEYG
jgi:hypothetical protein